MSRPSEFIWIVIAPGGPANAALAWEAAAAGAWGFVDLEDLRSSDEITRALRDIRKGPGRKIGIKLDASAEGIWGAALDRTPPQLARVLLSRPSRSLPALTSQITSLRRRGVEVLIEAISVDEAARAEQAGADGILAKGSEAGGRIGEETLFLLLQRLAGRIAKPIYAQGGVGLHTAAACQVAGARGAVVDWQVCLVEESNLPGRLKQQLSRLDGSETSAVGLRIGDAYRLFTGPHRALVNEFHQEERRLLAASGLTDDDRVARWRAFVDDTLTRRDGEMRKLGMDVSFAARLASEFPTVSAAIDGLDRSRRFHLARAHEVQPLGPGKGVARLLGIKYPIVQGPMSRVSDTPAFAAAVADGGGLPVMAVATMREDELEPMLRDTRDRLGAAPWSVGLLGFIPPDLYDKQMALVKKYRPPTVVIAGGRPAQAQQIESVGIRTWIHVPSHRLLDLYLGDGTRNMIFEGLECGGHIGRYSGFVLWENSVQVLLDHLPASVPAGKYSALFAGGISTPLSAAMVSTVVAPLADRGVDVGVLLGTAYLFTREAVDCGAIQPAFQNAMVEARQTAILDCGGGYQIRAAPSPFVGTFEEEKQRLIDDGLPAEEVRMTLEHLTLGRLRMAAKGLRFNEKYREDKSQPITLRVEEPDQQREGVYMAGQAILLHDAVFTVEELHRRISEESAHVLAQRAADPVRVTSGDSTAGDEAVAIVGMSALFPGADGASAYWENIFGKKYSITEVPPEQWSQATYFDSDPAMRDKIYSRWGGFLDPVAFDPVRYGMPPKSVRAIDPCQLLTLELVDRALRDARYDTREFDRERTSVFVGEGGGMGNLGQLYSLRSLLPMFLENVPEAVLSQLPDWTEDSFPGLLPNVIAGRITNQYDLGGTNLSTSAACAAGLAALSLGIDELRTRKSSMSIVAAVDLQQNPFMYLCFSKTHALSPTGTPRCFDATSDGIVISQGIGVVILKRLADAERDGDRIYAVLRGMGSSSDGRGKSLTSPTAHGQILAMGRAYSQAGFGLDTVELIEAHGTGTVLGDRTEAESIRHALQAAGAPARGCAVGTVKSMIGHTKGCAGIAGLIKVALALHHKVLPPTLGVTRPAADDLWTADNPAYLNTETRPWIGRGHPRRAAVSSFGFGGTNFHAAVEEYLPRGDEVSRFPISALPAELFAFRAPTIELLRADLDELDAEAAGGGALRDLAHRRFERSRDPRPDEAGAELRLAIVAESVADLRKKIAQARARLEARPGSIHDPSGTYFHAEPLAPAGRVAFIFPGQGSQRLDMLKDLTLLFGELRESFARADRTLRAHLPQPLSQYVFPPPVFDDAQQTALMEALTRTDVTQPALGAAGFGMQAILRAFGVAPDMAAGHSMGEYVALCAAGVFPEESLYPLLWARGSRMLEAGGDDTGTMMAVRGPLEALNALLRGRGDVFTANFNAPLQTVLSGRREALQELLAAMQGTELQGRFIPVGCGFHSPFVAKAGEAFAKDLAAVRYAPASITVYSNHLAAPYPEGEEAVRGVLGAHLSQPVRFADEIRRMHADGARIFVEVGPGRVCTSLIAEILEGQPHAAIACDGAASRVGTVRFLHALAQLFADGVPMRLDPLFTRRIFESYAVAGVAAAAKPAGRPQVTWMVSPDMSWPATEPRPQIRPVWTTSERTPQPVTPPVSSAAITAGKDVAMSTPPTAPPPGVEGAGSSAPRPTAAAAPQQPAPAASWLEPPPHASTPGDSLPALSRPLAAVAPVRPVTISATPIAARPSLDPGSLPASGPLAEVVIRHQKMMSAFLEQQKEVMLAYLGGQPGAAASPVARETAAPAVIPTPSPALTAAPPAVQSVAPAIPAAPAPAVALRPIVVPSVAASDGQAAAPPPAAPAAPAMDRKEVQERLRTLVSDRTGYPAEMLTPDQDMEADLGIDSIKRVEILTSFARQFPELPPTVGEPLRAARTLADVVTIVMQHLVPSAAATPERVPAAPPVPIAAAPSAAPVQPAAPHAAASVAPPPAAVTAVPTTEPAPAPRPQPSPAVAAPAPAAVAIPIPASDVMATFVALVSERTGYPPEMLTPEQDMEADLGIDSIKRVEILTSFARQFAGLAPSAAEDLRAARTLADVVHVVHRHLTPGATAAEPAAAAPPAAPAPTRATVPASQPIPAPPPVAAPQPVTAPPAATVAAPSGADLLGRLVALVAERTGYPPEMLTPEQDMEADLGIDSIKRVEILTAFARQIPDLDQQVTERLRGARTLQDVVDVVVASSGGAGGATAVAAAPSVVTAAAPENGTGLDRFVIQMKDSALPAAGPLRIPGGALLITDDGAGCAAALCERLRAQGGRPILIGLTGPEAPAEGIYTEDLTDPARVQDLITRIRRDHGAIGGVIHLLPLRPVPAMQDLTAPEFERLVDQEVKGLFYLLRYAAADLKGSPGAWVAACLSFGSAVIDGVLPTPANPWRGGVIGVIKTVTVEWPDAIAKSLVLEEPTVDLAIARILAELGGPRGEHEAYYRADRRLIPDPVAAPLQMQQTFVDLTPEDVVVLIGGARGITSEIAREMARQARPKLILVGRSPWPENESAATAGVADDRDLRKALFTEFQSQGRKASPVEIDTAARRILMNREMRAARAAMEAAGSTTHYHQADIRDGDSTAALFQRLYRTHGRIDGVISGAGIIEDKLIEDKTPESFDRVFDTKSRSIFHLARCLDPQRLKFFVIFSSVAGWTGNRGQVDYVAANEVLNRMALHLSARWSRRVVAIDWGPWEKAGMVTPEIRRQFLDRGVGLVPPEAGRRFLIDEIRFGTVSHPIVAAMGKLDAADGAPTPPLTGVASR